MWQGKIDVLLKEFNEFFENNCVPNEVVFMEEVAANRKRGDPFGGVPILDAVKKKAKSCGLWNLFLPAVSGLSQCEYATVAEVMGRIPCFVEAFNCDAPDTGNMEVLHTYGTAEQRKKWLGPLLNGEIRSAFCMTEPDVASSDASNIQCKADLCKRDGIDCWCINGTKWWCTGAGHAKCALFIVLVRTEGDSRHSSHTMLLVPRETSGVSVGRAMEVFGDDDAPRGHFEVFFKNAIVPVTSSTILGPGKGFEIAQGRLGPGRIHHCMRSIGMAERAFTLLVERSLTRKTFGRRLAQHGVVQQWISQCRIEIDQARLLVLHCAQLLDAEGCAIEPNKPKSLRLLQLISMIKVVVPRVACLVIDRAIQTHGAKGLSQDTILHRLYVGQRSLRIADGPDEVHEMNVARYEVKKSFSKL